MMRNRATLSLSAALAAAFVAAAAAVLALSSPVGAQDGGKDEFLMQARGDKLPPGLERKIERAGGEVTQTIPQVGLAVVESGEAGFEERAEQINGISSVVADIERRWIDPPAGGQGVDAAADGVGDPPDSGSSDPLFDLQWGHDAVDAPQAWDEGARGEGARVAILDSGIDADHPDLAPNLNTELSTSFVEGEDYDIAPGAYFNHGTHVAGTVAAAENGLGTIGVAPEAELMAVKVLSEETGSGSFSGIVQGIVYAAENDADIVNMSLGAYFPARQYCDDDGQCVSARETTELINAMKRAMQFANKEGTTVVSSAGNASTDLDADGSGMHVPSEVPGSLSISATGPEGWALDPNTNLDEPAFYTNYGQSTTDFAAPGGNIDPELQDSGRTCTVAGVTDLCYSFDLVYSTVSEGWGWAAGTSMASPHVSGVAAIIAAENGGDMKPSRLEAALRRSAEDLGKPGNDDYYGKGRVNAANAVR